MGGFFKRGEIVTVDGGEKRWRVDHVHEGFDKDGEAIMVADLSDTGGNKRTVNTELLEKVAS